MIVFTDTFTVGADVDIASYPGTPDYSYIEGSGSWQVQAASDQATIITEQDIIIRLLNAACPTVDQQITADCHTEDVSDVANTWDNVGLAARCPTGPGGAYVGYRHACTQWFANEVVIDRFDSGLGGTNLASADRGLDSMAAQTHSTRFKATGTNPVALELQVGATAVLTYEDSAADRLQSGRSGFSGYRTVATAGPHWIDNISVDDLVPEAMDMSWVTGDRVKETTTTTGTGALTLGGAVSAFRAFSVVCIDGDEIAYAILGGTEWEVGLGSWGTGNILNRNKVFASSNAGALVNFSAGTKEVWCDFPARYGLLPPTAKVLTEDVTLPMETSAYVADSFEVQAGNEIELEAGAVLEVG